MNITDDDIIIFQVNNYWLITLYSRIRERDNHLEVGDAKLYKIVANVIPSTQSFKESLKPVKMLGKTRTTKHESLDEKDYIIIHCSHHFCPEAQKILKSVMKNERVFTTELYTLAPQLGDILIFPTQKDNEYIITTMEYVKPPVEGTNTITIHKKNALVPENITRENFYGIFRPINLPKERYPADIKYDKVNASIDDIKRTYAEYNIFRSSVPIVPCSITTLLKLMIPGKK